MVSLIQHLEVESQPQNPDFRNNPENFHPCAFLKGPNQLKTATFPLNSMSVFPN